MRYLPLTPNDRAAMLARIGASSVDDFYTDVPETARLDGHIGDLPLHRQLSLMERQIA
ncbi:MAG: glycine dehydrogenase, partial [Pseudomonadota bacterium]